ncbi:MAG TPA: hypothetical protein VM537_18300, partial [Anaerolineae bacterium]|nr:hypothetical protein [Anaerolineae bacterium]
RCLARFGPMELLDARSPATSVRPGDAIPVDLRWRLLPGRPLDDYVVVLQLLAEDDRVVAGHEGQPVDGRYPTSIWTPGYPVRDQHDLVVPTGVPGGEYRLVVALDRASDGQRVQMRRGMLGLVAGNYQVVQRVQVSR